MTRIVTMVTETLTKQAKKQGKKNWTKRKKVDKKLRSEDFFVDYDDVPASLRSSQGGECCQGVALAL